MNLELSGRIALVTGGSKGIGASIVRRLSQEGVRIACCARPSLALQNLASEIQDAGGEIYPLECDVLNPRSVIEAVKEASGVWNGLDILINNVGGAIEFGAFEELSDEVWLKSFEFNVMSMVRFTRECLPFLRQSSLKRVINISSISAQQPGMFNPHYTITKAATVNLGKYLANFLASEQILVNTICPGPVITETWEKTISVIALKKEITYQQALDYVLSEERRKIPLGEIGEPFHISAAVALLASPLSSWTTGSCFHINGGKLSAIS